MNTAPESPRILLAEDEEIVAVVIHDLLKAAVTP